MTDQEMMDKILTEMFRRVGREYTPEFCQEEGWYYKETWTPIQEQDFADWMDTLLKRVKRWPKKQRQREIGMFLLSYGWRTEVE